MYYVSKRMEIAACHKLNLSYESKCANLHGHNWIITVYCKAEKLNKDGMVMDFKHIKQKIHGYLDHGNLNELLPCTTAVSSRLQRRCCTLCHSSTLSLRLTALALSAIRM